ncbi:hypothetical protein GOP47_0023377 [Adiantum capillus-veneris]|uniref:Uncharacterized protein n=1 Tax=Adiantum capillus-veneris TaxID=13818 RepID=A0A9D4U3S6_ADICA|nr:hypothetical protein GOP47_0023377 [Adiantum capillus-veneris]
MCVQVWEKYSHERTLDLVDEKLGNVFFPEQVVRLVHIALLCTQENPKQRPAMSMVTLWLSGMSDILEMPVKPTFLDYNDSGSAEGESNHEFTSTASISSHSIHVSRVQLAHLSGGVQSNESVTPR